MLKEIFSLFGTVGINNKDANKAIDETNNKASRLAVSMSKAFETAGKVITSAGKTITKVGKTCSIVTGTVTGVFTAASVKAKDFIGVYESARAIFERKLGSTGANEMYETLLNIAKGSRYAQEYIVSAGQTLVSMGVDANRTSKYIQNATNAMSGMGKSGADVQAMAEMFGKMSIQTTLYTEDLNQMLTSGIRVYDILAKKYKTTTDSIKEMASEGKLTSKDFEYLMDVLAGNVSGMEEFSMAGLALAGKSGTLTGAIDSLNSSFRSFALNITGTNINKGQMENYEKLKDIVSLLGTTLENVGSKFSFVSNWVSNGLDKLKTTLTGFNDALNNMSPENLQAIAKAILGVATAGPALLIVGKATETVGGAFSGLGKVNKTIETLSTKATNLPNVFSKIPQSVSKVTQAFGNFTNGIGSGFGLIFSEITPKFNSFFSSIGQGFQTFGSKIGTFFSPVSNVFKALGGKIGTFMSPVKNAIDGVIAKTSIFSQLVKFNIGESLNQAFPNFSAGVQKIFGSFSGLFSKITPAIQKFLPMFTSAFNIATVAGLVIAGLGVLQTNFGDEINKILQVATEKGPQIITNLVNGITSKLPDLIAKGSELIINLANTILANLPALIQGGIQIIASLVTGIAQQLPALIPKALEIILTVVTSLLDNIDKLIDAGIQLLIGLTQGLINAIPILLDKAPEIIEKLLKALIDNAPKIIQAGWQLIVSLSNGIINNFPKLVDAAGQIISTIWDTLKGLPGKAVEWGKDMIQGFIDGIKSMFSSIGNAVSSIGDKIKSFLHFSRPDEGPLRDYESWMPDMIEGLSKTLTKSAPMLYNTTKKLAQKVSDSLEFSKIPDTIKTSVDGNIIWDNNNLDTTPLAYKIAPKGQETIYSKNNLLQYRDSDNSNLIQKLIDILLAYFPQFTEIMKQPLVADDGTIIAYYTPKINEELNRIKDKEERGS